MTNIKHYQVLIIGSGPAGCTAAIYIARANLNFAMITGFEQGGQLMKTPEIENWPGETELISGMVLMDRMMNQVKKFSSNILLDSISGVDFSKRPFYLKGDDGEYSADAIIIATGASPRYLGLPSEEKYIGRGVSSCAICDGFFYKGKDVAVVGGGSSALEESLYLAEIASTVTLIHRRDRMRAEKYLLDKVKEKDNIRFELNYVVDEILGDEMGVTGVRIKNVNSEEIKDLDISGIFIAIGHKPSTDIFSGKLEMEDGYIKTGFDFKTGTSVRGVFSAGDVVAGSYKQAIVAAGSGCVAALDAKEYLLSLKG